MYDLKFNLLQLELINVLNRLNIEPNCNRLKARKQALVYRLWAINYLAANQNITDWHKINKNMKKFKEEYSELVFHTEIIEHPYKGLVDKKGSLTRYPVIVDKSYTLQWSRTEVEDYLKEGGNFDSFGCYGADPYNRRKLDSGIPAKLLGRFSTTHRLDFLPTYTKEFPLSDTITGADYMRLSNGVRIKEYLKMYGVRTNKSLLHLNKKGMEWAKKEVATKASFRAIIRILSHKEIYEWVEIKNNPFREKGNKPFLYAVKCLSKHENLLRGYPYPILQTANTAKLREYLLANNKSFHKIAGVSYYL